MKNVAEFNKFIGTVSLSKSQRSGMEGRIRAATRFLRQNLTSFAGWERQGSYTLRTIIRPVNVSEYDIDVLLFMKYEQAKEPVEYIEDVFRCLQREHDYTDKVRRKTRCVTISYAGDFHLDIVPCVNRGQDFRICNRESGQFELTNGSGYRNWFNRQSLITYGNLKPATRLLKYLRDYKGNFDVPSVFLTTLAGKSVRGKDDGANFKNIPYALKTTANRINDFLEKNPNLPNIVNPALSQEKFTKGWSQTKYANFRRMFAIYNGKINDAWEETDRQRSIEKWRELFGDNFGR